MRSALALKPSSRVRLDSSPWNAAEPSTLNTQLFQRSPATAGRCCSVPSFTSIARRGGTASCVRNRSRPARTELASCRRTMSSVSELSVTVLSVSVTSAKRPRPMKASVYSPPPLAGLRARDQDVHLGFGAIAHVVDELDLRLQEVRVATRRNRETPSAAKGPSLEEFGGRRRCGACAATRAGLPRQAAATASRTISKDELAHARLFWQ